jgi:hypothetical protein
VAELIPSALAASPVVMYRAIFTFRATFAP